MKVRVKFLSVLFGSSGDMLFEDKLWRNDFIRLGSYFLRSETPFFFFPDNSGVQLTRIQCSKTMN